MGRATSGVVGMKFRPGDSLLTMQKVVPARNCSWWDRGRFREEDVTQRVSGAGPRRPGIKVANLVEARGDLVGALVVEEGREVLAIMGRGRIVRSCIDEVSRTAGTPRA
jgi:DNA gyrase subunit A